jgi:hypothetical protein
MSNRGNGRGRRGRRGRGGRSNLGRRTDDLVVNRHEDVPLIVGGGAGYNPVLLAITPLQLPGVLAIARSYTEYRFIRFSARLISSGSSTSTGIKFLGYSFVDPDSLPDDYVSTSTLAAFRANQYHGSDLSARLPQGANQQRFYPVLQDDATPEQLGDPNLTQAWLVFGTNRVSGAPTPFGELHVSYTLLLRGPTRPTHQIPPGLRTLRSHLLNNVVHEDEGASIEEIE